MFGIFYVSFALLSRTDGSLSTVLSRCCHVKYPIWKKNALSHKPTQNLCSLNAEIVSSSDRFNATISKTKPQCVKNQTYFPIYFNRCFSADRNCHEAPVQDEAWKFEDETMRRQLFTQTKTKLGVQTSEEVLGLFQFAIVLEKKAF